jgi:hypothetical protein
MATAADREREARARQEHAALVAQWDAEAAWRKEQAGIALQRWRAIRAAQGKQR